MIRSNFAITRLIVLPFTALLLLYLVVVGGGGFWLYHQVRNAEARILVDNVLAQIRPLANKLSTSDALSQSNSEWLRRDARDLFASIPSLQNVSIKGTESGVLFNDDTAGVVSSHAVAPLPQDARRASLDAPPSQRLYGEKAPEFLIRFDLTEKDSPLVRLDFAFDREMLLANLRRELHRIRQAVILFSLLGAVSILLALLITLYAMRTTRRIEGYFQEMYQRASLTETAASLVHDLRNPLMALRANTRALLVTPDQLQDIVSDLDRDIVSLNDKLSAFLKLTRRHDDPGVVDLHELVDEVLRLARPVLEQYGVEIDVDMPDALPQPHWRRASMQDALLNVVINAVQSGQAGGKISLKIRRLGDNLEISVADRGRGIAAADLPHLFDPFYTTRTDGNGLGLAIVQRVVAEHHGSVRAENRAGGGAVFTMVLPIQQQEPPEWWKKLKKHSRT